MSLRVHLCASINHVQKADKRLKGCAAFIILDNTDDAILKNYLLKRGYAYLNKHELIAEKKEQLVFQTQAFLTHLNLSNDSDEWWKLSFTSKSLLNTPFPYRILNYLAFVEILKNKMIIEYENIIVIAKDFSVLAQIKLWIQGEKIKVYNYGWHFLQLKHLLPFQSTFVFLKMLLIKVYTGLWLSPIFDKNKTYSVIHSLIDLQSFPQNCYRDVFFGNLPFILKRKNIPVFVLGNIFSPAFKILGEIKRNKKVMMICPGIYFCSFFDLLRCYGKAILRHFIFLNLKGDLTIQGVPVDVIVRHAEREECQSQWYFINSINFYIAKGLTKAVRLKKFIYLFENRAWEKNLIRGLKECSKDIEILGYQHSSMSERHWNYMLNKQEVVQYPLPHRILTNGEISRNWFLNHLDMQPSRIHIAGAFRYTASIQQKKLKERGLEVKTFLCALASSLDEYVNVIYFLNQLDLRNLDFHFILRPHFLLPIEPVLKRVKPMFKFTIDVHPSFLYTLNQSDAVLYVSTTAALESLTHGVPVINIEIPDYVSSDPLLGFSDFKWCAKTDTKFLDVIQQINDMTLEEYQKRQELGCNYVKRYFYPFHESLLKVFKEEGS